MATLIMPKIHPRPLSLRTLATTDWRTAEVGRILNDHREGGVDLDGNPNSLTWDEFRLSAPGFYRLYPSIGPELNKLQALLLSTEPTPPKANDPGPGFVSPSSWVSPLDSKGAENSGSLIEIGTKSQFLFDRADAAFTRSQILVADAKGTSASSPLFAQGHKLQLAPSFAKGQVFFVGADHIDGAATFLRASYDGTTAGTPQKVRGLNDLSAISWPKVHELNDGSLMVAYRDHASRPRLAWSKDGVSFSQLPVNVEPNGAAMVSFGVMKDGTLALTYQLHDEHSYVSYVRLSKDGRTFGPRQPITGASNNVHDTSMVQRQDGGLDLYYVYTDNGPFALYRRALHENGEFGPEERISNREHQEINKPTVSRRQDGTLALNFVEVTRRNPQGWVEEQGLRSVTLTSDAPAK